MGSNECNHTETRREDWRTPQEMFDKLDRIFHFKFDLCADEHNSKTDFYVSEKMDLMSPQSLDDVRAVTDEMDYLWSNPPYEPHGGTGKYVGRAVEIAGPRGLVCLVPASVGSLWWKVNVWAHFNTLIFPRRFPFEGAGKDAKFDCAICIKWEDSASTEEIIKNTQHLAIEDLGSMAVKLI